MLDDLQKALEEGETALSSLSTAAELEEFQNQYLGRKGEVTLLAAGMRDLSKEEKPAAGQKLNEVRTALQSGLDAKQDALLAEQDASAMAGIDVTLPGRPLHQGSLHPVNQMRDRAVDLLRRMGFALATGPEIETEWHCFDALNTPADHPARNESDTFYFDDGKLLRTHTSSVQIRTMETTDSTPLRIIAPGSAYRRDEIDATHLCVFHQLEGLYVDEGVTLGDLKGTLEAFFRGMFGDSTEVRFRPHFFPFTEPSYEIDVKLEVEGSKAKWIEIAGCGMVDPAVFEAVSKTRGDDLFGPDRGMTGFAFGMGLERLAMIDGGIPDIRHLINNDSRFLSQFAK